MPIKVRHNGLELDNRLLPLISIHVPLAGLAQEAWPPKLDEAAQMGFGVISVDIAADMLDSVGAFLGLANEKNLKVIARPIPPQDSPAPFWDKFCSLAAPQEYPQGPVVAVRIQAQPVEADLAELTRHYLGLKYRQIKVLNEAYGSAWGSFNEISLSGEKPNGLAALKPRLDQAEAREYAVHRAFSSLAESLKEKGLQAPLFGCLPGSTAAPYNLPDLEKDSGLDFCGVEIPRGTGEADISDLSRFLFMSSGLPCLSGCPGGEGLLAPFIGGARALEIDPVQDGPETPKLKEMLKELNRFLKDLDWPSSFPQIQALLLDSREAHLAQISGAEEAGFFGPKDPGREGLDLFRSQARAFVRDKQFSWAHADTAIPTEKMKKASLIIFCGRGFLEDAFAKRLRAWVESGGILVAGPELPSLNQRLEPMTVFSDLDFSTGKPVPVGEGKIFVCQGSLDAKSVSTMLQRAKLWSDVSLSDKTLDLALHRLAGRQVIFVRNPHAEARSFTVNKEGKFVLKPLWAGGKFLGAVEEREVALGPNETRVWEVISC